jgi:hypothetical protein
MCRNRTELERRSSYTPETYYLLNKYTLKISDPTIRKTFLKKRSDKFNSFFRPICIIVGLMTFGRFYTHFARYKVPLGDLLFKFLLVIWLVLWKLLQRFRKDWTPWLVFFPAVMYAILGNLQLWDKLPVAWEEANHEAAIPKILLVWMILFLGNYNSFVVTSGIVALLFPIYGLIIYRVLAREVRERE